MKRAISVLLLLFSLTISAQFTSTFTAPFSKMNANYGNAVADYDLDGDLDIFIVAYNSFKSGDEETWSRLLNNKGSRFEDVTIEAGFRNQHKLPSGQDVKLSASWGDYNNDGYPDLLLGHQNGTQLYRNQDGKSFKEVTDAVGIIPCTACNNSNALWWDYDNDGDLDLYLAYLEHPNRLYNNKGDGTFEEIPGALNLDDTDRTWSCLPIDANRDGWMDIYVVNDFGLANFYLNQNGQSFIDVTEEYGLTNIGDGMGSAIGDYNNDGYFDIYITNIAEFVPNPLFKGSENGPFVNENTEEGVGNAEFGWGTQFLDADNDGDQDLYAVNGNNELNYTNFFFKNLRTEGEDRFEDWSMQSQTNGFANGMAVTVFDYDTDGGLDILVSNTNDKPYLYKNNRANGNAWLQVALEGTVSNRNAFGTTLTAYADGKSYHRFYHGAAIMGQSIKPVHFGLGAVEKIDSLVITWPRGYQEKIYDIARDQKIRLVEQQGMQEGELYVPSEEQEGNDIIEEPKSSEEKTFVAYPNPFNEIIEFHLNIEERSMISMEVFTISGVKIYDFKEEVLAPTDWVGYWKGINHSGSKMTSGIYLYKITTSNKTWSGKVVLH